MGETVFHKTKDRVTVGYSRKINIGNYESIDIHASYGTDLKKDESVDEAFARADGIASAKLEEFSEPIEKVRNKKGGK